ncbi:unnamed protein product [Dicrocoelium dendriticum]|nr:unnamed protein product [Dicrocoelium dendriticum]
MTRKSVDSESLTDGDSTGPSEIVSLPLKRFYRQRAHCNPWSDHTFDYPISPEHYDWEPLYASPLSGPAIIDPLVRFVDVGCGYGRLLISLATMYPSVRSLGLEIRLKVCDFVQRKICALRSNYPGQYNNIACLRTNAMKFLPNFFRKGQLQKLFFLYPDPHFKRMKHKWRIISPTLLDVYAYVLCPGGRLYAATDVPELATWIADCLRHHPLFRIRSYIPFVPSDDGKSLRLNEMHDWEGCTDSAICTQDALDNVIRDDPVLRLFQQCTTDESLKALREGRGTVVLVCDRTDIPL